MDTVVARYLKLYSECSKGRDKYAQLFLRWLDVVRSYTCEAYKAEETKGLLQSAMEKYHQLGVNVSDCTKRTVTAIILIDEHHKHLKAKPSSDMANELNLLEAMKLPSEVKQSLPVGSAMS